MLPEKASISGNLTAESECKTGAELEGFAIDARQSAGQAETNRARVAIGLGRKAVRFTGTKEFTVGF